MPRCAACPVPAEKPCPAIDAIGKHHPHPRYCELVATHPARWCPVVLKRAEGIDFGAEAEAVPILSRVRNLLREGAAWAAAGIPLRTPEHQAACLLVCLEGEGLEDVQTIDGHCDHYRPSDGTCGGMKGCGCIVKYAVMVATKACPLDRGPDPPDAPAPAAGP